MGASLVAGVALIGVRQIWTVQMGMRGLVITDLVQGIVANGGSALLCLGLLWFSREASTQSGDAAVRAAAPAGAGRPVRRLVRVQPDPDGRYRLAVLADQLRIYTASGVGAVKKGTVQTMIVAGGFYALLTLVALAASGLDVVSAKPQDGWFTLLYRGRRMDAGPGHRHRAGRQHGLGGRLRAGLRGADRHIVQVVSPRTDRRMTIIAKASMAVFMLGASVVAFLTYDFPRLQLLAQMSYQGIVQLAVPLFLGMFWRGGNRIGALLSMGCGFTLAAVLTWFYPDDMPGLGSLTSGVLALGVNLLLYLGCHVCFGQSEQERERVRRLFDAGRANRRSGGAANGASGPGLNGRAASA